MIDGKGGDNATLIAELATAVADPVRARIFLSLLHQPGTAATLATDLDLPPAVVAEHLKGFLTPSGLAWANPVTSLSGSPYDTIYQGSADVILHQLDWPSLPDSLEADAKYLAILALMSVARAAATAGVLIGPPAPTVVFRPISVDAQGWHEVSQVLIDARARFVEIEDDCLDRVEFHEQLHGFCGLTLFSASSPNAI
jgi:hypothetical protein